MTEESKCKVPPFEGFSAPISLKPCVLVIFGVTGDLTARKLMPALYNLAIEDALPKNFACLGFARRSKNNETFRREMKEAVSLHSRTQPLNEEIWNNFESKLYYHQSEFDSDQGYESLLQSLKKIDCDHQTMGNRIFYLATQPSFFTPIIEKLSKHGHIIPYKGNQQPYSRVIIEKPFGNNLSSAEELQKNILQYLDEKQIYRIDHYLGKEKVQNLLTFRFSNAIFSAIWNNKYIDHIQISATEDIGIGTRGRFWEETGLLRDMIQNHLMQLLTLIAMEPPTSSGLDQIRTEKVKVLEALRLLKSEEIDQHVTRGQYGPGFVNKEKVKGYREEDNVDPSSNCETFVALKLHIDNERWSNVPFYLVSGKRLPQKCTEIKIAFKSMPNILFAGNQENFDQNVLYIRIQPDESITLDVNCKVPGLSHPIQPVKMDFKYQKVFDVSPPEAYERLICDAILGDPTLFARYDEVETSWKFITPILENWEQNPHPKFPNYEAGSWGPKESKDLFKNNL